MPGNSREVGQAARQVAAGLLAPDCIEDIVWADSDRITREEIRDVCALAAYAIRMRARYRPEAQRRALRLLRRFLTPDQQRQMRACRYFHVTAPSGRLYRLHPYSGSTWRIERHGKRFFGTHSYCLHDYPEMDFTDRPEERRMPPADLALAHLFLLTTDEEEFLRQANETDRRTTLWNGDWLRTLARARRERAAAHAGEAGPNRAAPAPSCPV